MISRQLRRLLKRVAPPTPPPPPPEADVVPPAVRRMKAQQVLEVAHEELPDRTPRIGEHMVQLFAESGLKSGRILEIGGRLNPYADWFPDFEYVCLDLEETGPGVIRGDITNCPEIASASFDAVISVDVFEHISEPWLAAPEIVRLLRPGGFTYHSTLFSWRYHPCPEDYWRYTPAALKLLFKDLTEMDSGFDTVERRRNLIGKGQHRLTPDAFGGWRENWRVFYAGQKDPNSVDGDYKIADPG